MGSVTVTIPQYIKYVQLSAQRKPKYYTSKDRIPSKYNGLGFSPLGYLLDGNSERVVKNVRCVGTPSLKKINGQDLYSGNMRPHMRAKVVGAIKSFFEPYVKHVGALQFPIRIRLELHDMVGKGNWDLDNLWLYNKCFQDVMIDEGLLPDDSVLYITAAAAPEFFPVDTDEERKLVFILEPETRSIILNHPAYDGNLQRESIPKCDYTVGTRRAVKSRRKRTTVYAVTTTQDKPKAAKPVQGRGSKTVKTGTHRSGLDKANPVPPPASR